jgi:VIT1/CCC1 family predicted Fe2+/Mn2+ transporter
MKETNREMFIGAIQGVLIGLCMFSIMYIIARIAGIIGI